MTRFSNVLLTTLLAALPLVIPLSANADYVKPQMQHAPFGEVKVVVPLTSADPAVWNFKLRNALNGVKGIRDWGGALDVKFVLYGAGVKMLMQPDEATRSAIDQLRSAGVKFEICNNTLMGMNLDWHELYDVQQADIVPAGFLEVGWLANHGWAVEALN